MPPHNQPNLRIVGPLDEALIRGDVAVVPLHRSVRPIDLERAARATRDHGMQSHFADRREVLAGFKLTLAERLADMVREDWPAVVFGFALGLMCICIPAIVLGAVL